MNDLMEPSENMPTPYRRETNARLHHVKMVAHVTQYAASQQAEVVKESVARLLSVVNEVSLLLEAFHLRNGDDPFVDQLVFEILVELKQQYSTTYQLLGTKMVDAINSLPSEPHVVGFLEEVCARFMDSLFGDTPPDRDLINEFWNYSKAAKSHMASAAKNAMDGIKETLNNQAVKG